MSYDKENLTLTKEKALAILSQLGVDARTEIDSVISGTGGLILENKDKNSPFTSKSLSIILNDYTKEGVIYVQVVVGRHHITAMRFNISV